MCITPLNAAKVEILKLNRHRAVLVIAIIKVVVHHGVLAKHGFDLFTLDLERQAEGVPLSGLELAQQLQAHRLSVVAGDEVV